MEGMNMLDDNHCSFVIPRKTRKCKMQRRDGEIYCAEHCLLPVNTDSKKRIQCPLDPKHTCNEKQLETHLKKCNSRKVGKPYLTPSINKVMGDEESEKRRLCEYSDEAIKDIIAQSEMFQTNIVNINFSTHSHFKNQLQELPDDGTAWKHLIQNASIVDCMQSSNLLKRGLTYVELGSGRGQLSHSLAQVLSAEATSTPTSFVLVDRASQRHKFDPRIKSLEHFQFQRVKADITDLVLDKLPLIDESDAVVVIAKHLCGGATDVALNCIGKCDKVVGVVIAICCHHKCNWSSFCNQNFIETSGFNQEKFTLLTKISSWYTCGMKSEAGETEQQNGEEHQTPREELFLNRYEEMGLDTPARQRIGVKCKNILNEGRVKFLTDLGYKTNLMFYVEPSVSPENVLLIAVKK